MTGRNIYKYSVALEISNQSLSSSSCDITIITRSGALPRVSGDSPAYNLTCTSSTPSCKMEFDVYSPEVEKWQYLLIQNNVGKTIVVMQLVVNLFGEFLDSKMICLHASQEWNLDVNIIKFMLLQIVLLLSHLHTPSSLLIFP